MIPCTVSTDIFSYAQKKKKKAFDFQFAAFGCKLPPYEKSQKPAKIFHLTGL